MPATQEFRTNDARYELIRAIHEGPIATVWHARDTIGGADVAVKQLNGANATDATCRARLREEAVLTGRISHPGAVPPLDTIFTAKRAALVFPYLSGKTLSERLHGNAPLAPRDAARIALDVADVLAAAHTVGIVHRDVKPANIVLADDGRIRLVDFGIASTGQPLELTGSGMAIGTLPYMSPEQLTGSRPTPAADVFALGVVLYEMLAGRRPYKGRSPAEQLELHGQPPPPLKAPEALSAIVAAMLSPMPGERPSAEQAGRTLRGWLDGRLEAEAETAAVVAAQSAAPMRMAMPRLVGAGFAAAIVVLLGAVTFLGFNSLPPAAPVDDATPPAAAIGPTTSPTPTRTPTPPPAVAPANQPTASRSGPVNDSAGPKAEKKEGKKKKGHGGKRNGKGEGRGDRGNDNEGRDDEDGDDD